jgi:diguanylate cyclase (GGDEF)-like protein
MPNYLEIALILSAIAQALAAIIALRELHLAGSFRLSWICISIALFLMLQRRLLPIWHVYNGGQEDQLNTYIGLAISVFMLWGIMGLKRLFQLMHDHELELEKLAHTDFLTGLVNRRYFMEKVAQELNRALRYQSKFSLLMFDIDFFKQVNDSYGHHIGDIVLQKVAQYCQKTVRSVDIIGRIGGEEFAVFLPESDYENALDVAERLRKGIEKTLLASVGGKEVYVTVSIGLVSVDSVGRSIDALLDMADKALYEAKTSGRNKTCRSR